MKGSIVQFGCSSSELKATATRSVILCRGDGEISLGGWSQWSDQFMGGSLMAVQLAQG